MKVERRSTLALAPSKSRPPKHVRDYPSALLVKDTGDHREKKGLETFLSFERYRGIVDAHRVGLGEKEHALTVSKQV